MLGYGVSRDYGYFLLVVLKSFPVTEVVVYSGVSRIDWSEAFDS